MINDPPHETVIELRHFPRPARKFQRYGLELIVKGTASG